MGPAAILSILVSADSALATAKLSKFDKQLEATDRVAKKGIQTRLAGTFDPEAFKRYEASLSNAARRAKDREAFKAQLGANFNNRAFNQYERAVERAGVSSKAARVETSGLSGAFTGLGRSAVGMAASLAGVSFGLFAIGKASLDAKVQFQRSMELLHTQAGVSQRAVGALSKAVLNMAPSVATGPKDLADAMYHVASSLNATLAPATRVATEMKVLRVAAEGAKVGNANLVDVTNALDAAIVSGIKGVQNYSQAMGALSSVVGAGDMTMQDLADAFSTGLLAPMKTYGLSLRDVGGALATFGDNNIRGQEAATKLISAVRIMAAPSKAAAKELATVGLSTLSMANDMRKGGLLLALEDLKKHMEATGLTASEQGLVIARSFGGRQSTGVQVLLQQLDRLKAKTAEVGRGAGSFGQDYAATTHTLAFQLDRLKATFGVLEVAAGTALAPLVPSIVKAGQSILVFVKQMQSGTGAGGSFAATITGAFKTVKSVITTVVDTLGGLGNTLKVVLAAFAVSKILAFTGALRTMFGVIRTESTVGMLAGMESGMLAGVGKAMTGLRAGLSTALSGALKGLNVAAIGTVLAQTVGSSVHGALGSAIKSIGTDTAIGAGFGRIFGPYGAAGGAMIGGLYGAFQHFIAQDAERQGRAFADRFVAPLPGKVQQSLTDALAKAKTTATITPKTPDTSILDDVNKKLGGILGPTHAITIGVNWVSNLFGLGSHTSDDPKKQFDKWFNAMFDVGQKAGKSVVAGLQSVKLPTQWGLIPMFTSSLAKLQGPARDEAAKVMLTYAQGLVKSGKLPKAQFDAIVSSLERSFSGLAPYVAAQGFKTSKEAARTLSLAGALKSWTNALAGFRKSTGDTQGNLKITWGNIARDTAQAQAFLTTIIKHGSKQQRLAALNEYDLLQTQVSAVFQQIAQDFLNTTAVIVKGMGRLTGAGLGKLTMTPPPGLKGAPQPYAGAARAAVQAQAAMPSPASQAAASQAAQAAAPSAATQSAAAAGGMSWGTNPTTGRRVYHSAEEWQDIWATYRRHHSASQTAAARRAAAAAQAAGPAAAKATSTFVAPSQTIVAQIRLAQLSNQLQVAQNANNTAAQQRALGAEVKLERLLLKADEKRLLQVNNTLKNSHLSSAKRAQALQNRLTLLQEIGNMESSIGTAMSSLTGLAGAGGTGAFNLAPGQIKLPTAFDVARAIGRQRIAHHHPVLHGQIAGPTHAVSVNPTININVERERDGDEVKKIVHHAVAKMADDIDRSVSSRLRARQRSRGYRGT